MRWFMKYCVFAVIIMFEIIKSTAFAYDKLFPCSELFNYSTEQRMYTALLYDIFTKSEYKSGFSVKSFMLKEYRSEPEKSIAIINKHDEYFIKCSNLSKKTLNNFIINGIGGFNNVAVTSTVKKIDAKLAVKIFRLIEYEIEKADIPIKSNIYTHSNVITKFFDNDKKCAITYAPTGRASKLIEIMELLEKYVFEKKSKQSNVLLDSINTIVKEPFMGVGD